MKHILSILLLACISLSSYAQTPYDSFAPETSRPVLELSEIKESKEGSKKTALTNPFDYPQEPASPLTDNVDINNIDYPDLQYGCSLRKLQSLTLKYNQDILLQSMMDNCEIHGAEQDIYYTHSDHLGSANWITDKNGAPVQYLHYLPYGQLLANQQVSGSTYDERYKFTGKERDEESGYDYFGARYYIPPLLHWSSVDPLVDKYLWISPYAYCAWNPMKFVDKAGLDISLFGINKSSVTIKTDLINLNVDISKLNVDFGGTYNFQGDEILSATLDIAGIFDPYGIADGLNAALQMNNGDVGGAAISALGLIPYAGDLAKVGKVKKDLGVINNAIEAANKGKREFVYIGKGENRRAIPVPEGFKKIKERTSNGQPIFRKGNKYFSPDRDQHSGGTWKRADSPKALESKATRDGTYDENLQRIGD